MNITNNYIVILLVWLFMIKSLVYLFIANHIVQDYKNSIINIYIIDNLNIVKYHIFQTMGGEC